MFQIGSTLREARQRQGLELTDVERETRIRARYLAALEEERFDLVPGRVENLPGDTANVVVTSAGLRTV